MLPGSGAHMLFYDFFPYKNLDIVCKVNVWTLRMDRQTSWGLKDPRNCTLVNPGVSFLLSILV